MHARSPVLYSAACIFRALQSCSSPSMTAVTGVSLDIDNYCTVSLFFEQAYL
ncbi:hypothetical protein S887_004444 [Salmonella enterica subsp. diarizonae]|nr:hypothetical protein [Salmonella enterica subsp. diarizonae]